MIEERIVFTLIRMLQEILETYFVWVVILILMAIVCDGSRRQW